ncbi:MAG TPA: DUF1194 domain-containing protein [Aliidongia sp.]|nr:DUF1194 domain-containing protein [Aliidongia sp.]
MRRLSLMICVIFLLMPLAAAAPGGSPLDLALVLAVDVSRSVNDTRYNLQRDGYAQAFRDPAVIAAIADNAQQGVAVTLVEWSGVSEQSQLVPWTIITDRASSERFASAVEESERRFAGWTSISAALDFSSELLKDKAVAARRRVIDVSGDGSNNNGRPIGEARDEAVAAGITINGLPILTVEAALDSYYEANVIGGPGAFIIPTENFETFAKAIQTKLIREIADWTLATRLAAGTR